MIRKFRNRKIGKENQKELEVMLTAICIDDEDAEIPKNLAMVLKLSPRSKACSMYIRSDNVKCLWSPLISLLIITS